MNDKWTHVETRCIASLHRPNRPGTLSTIIVSNASAVDFTVTNLADGTYTFTLYAINGSLESAASLQATAIVVNLYLLTITTPTGGTINNTTPTAGPYAAGTSITLTAAPAGGYRFAGWTAAGLTLTPAEAVTNPLTFSMPANSVTLAAAFITLNIGRYEVNTPGCPPLLSESGSTWTLSCGGTLTSSDDGTEYKLSDGSTVNENDGNVTVGSGGGEAVTGGCSTVDLSGGTKILPNGDGSGHTVVRPGSNGLTVTFPDGSTVHVPDDGSVVAIHPSYPGGLRIIGAPVPPQPVLRPVTLKLPAGITSQQAAGIHHVSSGSDLVFTLTLPSGQIPTIKTDRLIQGEPEVLTGVSNADGSYTFTVRQIRQTLEITVTSDVGNADAATLQVWSHGGKLYVRTAKSYTLYIYTLAGQLYRQQQVDAGETVIELPQGFYIVVMDGKRWKVAAP